MFIRVPAVVAIITLLISGSHAIDPPKAETFEFQAQVSKVMHMIIHSMYTNTEVFLRELLSNASDALDKVRLTSLQDRSILEANPEMKIRVYADKAAGTLCIEDTGIGMTKKELIENLGTIAKSGTGEFFKKAAQAKAGAGDANNLIGQFGVGFYAAYLVADEVQVSSKSVSEDKQYLWKSVADSQTFSVVEDTADPPLKRGTRITLFMKEDKREFLEQDKLEELIRKYSQFFNYPIYLSKQVEETAEEEKKEPEEELKGSEEKTEDEKTEAESEEKADSEAEEKTEGEAEEKTENEAEEKTEEKKTVTVQKDIHMNPNKPIWLRDPKDVSKEEYIEFYKSYFNDSSDPVSWVHFTCEGDVVAKVLFFMPKRPPFSPFTAKSEREEQTKTVALYVRRVFIKREQMFSEAMSPFLAGIIDSDDLPLNVSRETLQNSALVEQIRRKSANKVLDRLADLAENDKKTFETFYSAFSPNLKLEIIQSDSYRKRLSKLLQFPTTKSETPISLSQYVEQMKEGQKFIYFLAGRDIEELKKSPLVEGFIAQDIQVILATEAIDEYCMQALVKYDEFDFKNVAKEKAVDKKVSEDDTESYKALCGWLKKEVLEREVSDVILSSRLTDSSCAVAASEYGMSGHMESVMRAQAGSTNDPMMKFMEMQKRILELNPKHPVVAALKDAYTKGALSAAKDIARTIYDAALIRSGFALKNSKQFMDGIDRLVLKSLHNAPADPKKESAEEPKKESAEQPKKEPTEEPKKESPEQATKEDLVDEDDQSNESSIDGHEDL